MMRSNGSTEHNLPISHGKKKKKKNGEEKKAMLDTACCIINKQVLQTLLSLLWKGLLEERVAQEQMERGHLNTV